MIAADRIFPTRLCWEKGFQIAIMLVLQGCCPLSPKPWLKEVAQTWCADYNSVKVHFPSQSMEIEFIKGNYGLRMYLNLMICPIQSQNDQTSFVYEINEITYLGNAYVFEGGQRLLVSDHDRAVLSEALRNGCGVRIKVGMYNEKFESANFYSLFNSLFH